MRVITPRKASRNPSQARTGTGYARATTPRISLCVCLASGRFVYGYERQASCCCRRMKLSRGRRLAGIGLSVVIFFVVSLLVERILFGVNGEVSVVSMLIGAVAVFGFWMVWRRDHGKPKT